MERMLSEDDLTSALAPAYLANYTGTIDYITSNGAYAIVDPHNFGRFYGDIIEDTAGFQTFCTCCHCRLVSVRPAWNFVKVFFTVTWPCPYRFVMSIEALLVPYLRNH